MLNARALGQSVQAEQGTLILYSTHESVVLAFLRPFDTIKTKIEAAVHPPTIGLVVGARGKLSRSAKQFAPECAQEG